jgi:hypothetical protein
VSRALASLLVLLAICPAARADVYVLTDGDRISGKTVLKGKTSFALQTAYGRLTIPRAKVEKILHDDGQEELVSAPPSPPPTPPPLLKLELAITGSTFWYAWHPEKAHPPRAVLQLQLTLDEETIATWLDAKLDPEGISGAVVNTFGFGAEDSTVTPAPGVEVRPSEVKPGRILLLLELPPTLAGKHRLRLAYQADTGPPGECGR